MTNQSRKRQLWIATESSYGQDPSSNGSGYASVPCFAIGDLEDKKDPLETKYVTGRQWDTAEIAGPDGWALSKIEVPLIGLSAAAGDGTNASSVSDDWLDLFLTHVLGTQATTEGEGLASGSTSSTLNLDSDKLDVQHLTPVYESGVPTSGPRTQWGFVTVDNSDGTYSVAPNWVGTPTTAGVAYGTKTYRLNDAGGATLALVVGDNARRYTCLGGRVRKFGFKGEAGKTVRLSLDMGGDSKTEDAASKTSLPAYASPANTPIKALQSPVWFNGTRYATRSFAFEMGLETAEIESTEAENGRAGDENVSQAPTLTIEPLFATTWETIKRAQTTGRLLLQLGSGVLSGGKLNTCCLAFDECTAKEVTRVDSKGILRQMVQFKASDSVFFSAGVNSHLVQFARA